MRGISFHLDDKEEARRDKLAHLTNKAIFLLGVSAAEVTVAAAPAEGPESEPSPARG